MARQVPLLDRRLRWLAVVLIAGGILLASVIRPDGVRDALGPLGIVGLDKWLHALAYAALSITLAYAFAEWDATTAAIAVFVLAMAFGLGIELVQAAVPYRDFSWLDLLANGIGAAVVAVAYRAVDAHLCFRRRPVL